MVTRFLLLALLVLTHHGVRSQSVCPQGCSCSTRFNCSQLPRNVTTLQVHGMAVPRLADGAFRGLRHLRELDVENNGIQDMEENTFRPLESLQELSLSDNLLREVPAAMFSHNRQLSKMLLNSNPLSQAPELRSATLTWLEIDGCGLATLSPTTFNGTPNLMYLSMDRNNLTSLPRSLFQPLAKLRYLHAEDNMLKSLAPDTFSSSLILEMVYLSSNQLTLPSNGPFLTVPSLLILELASNNLGSISADAFQRLPMLRSLKLSKNNLQELPTRAFFMLKELKILDLRNNNLTIVHPKLFVGFKIGTTIDISENPLECDCTLLRVQRFPEKLNGVIVSSDLECSKDVEDDCGEESENGVSLGDVETNNGNYGNGSFDGSNVDDVDNGSNNVTLLVPKIISDVFEKSPRLAMSIGGAVIIVMVIALSVGTYKACRRRNSDSYSYKDDVNIDEEFGSIRQSSFVWRGFVDLPANRITTLSGPSKNLSEREPLSPEKSREDSSPDRVREHCIEKNGTDRGRTLRESPSPL